MVKGTFDVRALTRDYGDVNGEAASCRSAVALFDFSFMSRLRIEGPGACALIGKLTPRRVDDLAPGRIRYALSVDAAGRVRGDLTVWRLDCERFEVFTGTGDAAAALQGAAGSTALVHDLSTETAILALQGPASLQALAGLSAVEPLRALPYFAHTRSRINGVPCQIGRLGYTGERGFEIVLPRAEGEAIWTVLARHARPAGFAAADLLRIEAGFILFANELRFPVSSAELGLEQFAPAPVAKRGSPAAERRVRLLCFRAACACEPVLWQPSQPGPPFPPAPGTIVVSSACRSTLAGDVLGLGYALAAPSPAKLVDAEGQFHDICEASLPFYDPSKRRPRGGWRADLLPDYGASFIQPMM
jgi:glycine cleavage system aminomethyltransferase T